MSADARVNPTVGHTSQTEGMSLSAFLARVKAAINSAIPEPVWVRAEIRKVQTAESGSVYLELEERSDNKNYKLLKDTADWLARQEEPDIDQLTDDSEHGWTS